MEINSANTTTITRTIELYMVGDNVADARNGLLFDGLESATDYAEDEGVRYVYSVKGTVQMDTLTQAYDMESEREDALSKTYKIVRHFFSDDEDNVVIATGLTLEEAQAHCNDPETSSQTATDPILVALTEKVGSWFDGYTDESN